jgi:hypothetical protein
VNGELKKIKTFQDNRIQWDKEESVRKNKLESICTEFKLSGIGSIYLIIWKHAPLKEMVYC